jgi:hypothetical protein
MITPSNLPPAKNPQALWEHFSDTYFSLRVGLAVLAIAFPLVLYFYGKVRYGLDLQPSMSAYFFAASADQCASFPMRTLFVGFLFAIGVGLYLYKGITDLENVLLNAAGVCAALVAIFPERMHAAEAQHDERIRQLFASCPAVQQWAEAPQAVPIHYMAAVLLFAVLAFVAWACACKTLEYLPPDKGDATLFRRTYRVISVLMVLCPVTGLLLTLVLRDMSTYVFFVEAAGIWTFGAYWWVKSRELSLSRLETNPEEAVRRAPPASPAHAPRASPPHPTFKMSSTSDRNSRR